MKKFFDFLFGLAEEINGDFRCNTYLYRWIVFRRLKGLKIYLHHFVGNDWSRDLHDHPKRFVSIGLWGWYIEEFQKGSIGVFRRSYRAPWIRSFPATHIHRLIVPSGNCWTLVIVLKPVREWGFWHAGKFIHWKEYVYGSAARIADEQKDC